jgi:hypothetical protein
MTKRDTKLINEAMEVAREIPMLAKGFKRLQAMRAFSAMETMATIAGVLVSCIALKALTKVIERA